MAKLHEILAVESDLEGVYKKTMEETKNTFSKKPTHFMGYHKKLEMFEETTVETPEEHHGMATTVADKIAYVNEHIKRYIDCVYQKEATNQGAMADIVIDSVTIGKNLPATFLLGLETKLKKIREMYEAIPTLQPGMEWKKNDVDGKDIWKSVHPDEKLKTAKTFMHKVLYEATDKHPAQIEKWEEQKPVGKYVTEVKSGMLSPVEKSALLGRLDKLIQAIKKARQRANATRALEVSIGKELFDYIVG